MLPSNEPVRRVPGLRLVMYLEPDIDRGASDPVSWQHTTD